GSAQIPSALPSENPHRILSTMSKEKPEAPVSSQISRRDMLKRTALGLSVPFLLSSCTSMPARRSSPAASNTLRLGCIGNGRMGRGDMTDALKQGLHPEVNARVVAVCAADSNRALQAKVLVEKFYADNLPDAPRARIAIYSDYRDMLARNDIDGVTISTPDHWH